MLQSEFKSTLTYNDDNNRILIIINSPTDLNPYISTIQSSLNNTRLNFNEIIDLIEKELQPHSIEYSVELPAPFFRLRTDSDSQNKSFEKIIQLIETGNTSDNNIETYTLNELHSFLEQLEESDKLKKISLEDFFTAEDPESVSIDILEADSKKWLSDYFKLLILFDQYSSDILEYKKLSLLNLLLIKVFSLELRAIGAPQKSTTKYSIKNFKCICSNTYIDSNTNKYPDIIKDFNISFNKIKPILVEIRNRISRGYNNSEDYKQTYIADYILCTNTILGSDLKEKTAPIKTISSTGYFKHTTWTHLSFGGLLFQALWIKHFCKTST